MSWGKYEKYKTFFVTAWKVFKCGVISGPNTGKYGPEIIHAVRSNKTRKYKNW